MEKAARCYGLRMNKAKTKYIIKQGVLRRNYQSVTWLRVNHFEYFMVTMTNNNDEKKE